MAPGTPSIDRRALFGGLAPGGAAAPATSPPAVAAAPPPDDTLWKLAGSLLANGYVALVATIEKRRGYIANEPEADALEKIERGAAGVLRGWFPDTALTPGKELVIGCIFVAGGMCLGAAPDPEHAKRLAAAKAAAAKAAPPAAHVAPTTPTEARDTGPHPTDLPA